MKIDDCKKCIHFNVCYLVAECYDARPNFSCNYYVEERTETYTEHLLREKAAEEKLRGAKNED